MRTRTVYRNLRRVCDACLITEALGALTLLLNGAMWYKLGRIDEKIIAITDNVLKLERGKA